MSDAQTPGARSGEENPVESFLRESFLRPDAGPSLDISFGRLLEEGFLEGFLRESLPRGKFSRRKLSMSGDHCETQ